MNDFIFSQDQRNYDNEEPEGDSRQYEADEKEFEEFWKKSSPKFKEICDSTGAEPDVLKLWFYESFLKNKGYRI